MTSFFPPLHPLSSSGSSYLRPEVVRQREHANTKNNTHSLIQQKQQDEENEPEFEVEYFTQPLHLQQHPSLDPLSSSLSPAPFSYSRLLSSSSYGHGTNAIDNPKSFHNKPKPPLTDRVIKRVDTAYLDHFTVPASARRGRPQSPTSGVSTKALMDALEKTCAKLTAQYKEKYHEYEGITIPQMEAWLFHDELSEGLARIFDEKQGRTHSEHEQQTSDNNCRRPSVSAMAGGSLSSFDHLDPLDFAHASAVDRGQANELKRWRAQQANKQKELERWKRDERIKKARQAALAAEQAKTMNASDLKRIRERRLEEEQERRAERAKKERELEEITEEIRIMMKEEARARKKMRADEEKAAIEDARLQQRLQRERDRELAAIDGPRGFHEATLSHAIRTVPTEPHEARIEYKGKQKANDRETRELLDIIQAQKAAELRARQETQKEKDMIARKRRQSKTTL